MSADTYKDHPGRLGTVTITKAEYDQLKSDQAFLGCLQDAGVDNWEWYGEVSRTWHEQFSEA